MTVRLYGSCHFDQRTDCLYRLLDLDPSYEADRRPGWNRACSLTSPMAVQDISKKPDIPELWTRPKTFIWDHKRSMDPCLHVNHIHLNGLFSAHGVGPAPRKTMVPSFSGCTTQLHADILAVAPEKWTEDVGVDPSWSEKKHDTLLWRGSNTGDHFHANGNWNLSQRIRFVRAANEQEGFLDVLKSNGSPKEVVGTPRKASKAEMNKAMMDVGFAGHAIQCEPEICKIVENEFAFKERQSTEGANQWKFILDVSPRTRQLRSQTYDVPDGWKWLVRAFQAPNVDELPDLQGHDLPRMVHRPRPTLGALRPCEDRLHGSVRHLVLFPWRRTCWWGKP